MTVKVMTPAEVAKAAALDIKEYGAAGHCGNQYDRSYPKCTTAAACWAVGLGPLECYSPSRRGIRRQNYARFVETFAVWLKKTGRIDREVSGLGPASEAVQSWNDNGLRGSQVNIVDELRRFARTKNARQLPA